MKTLSPHFPNELFYVAFLTLLVLSGMGNAYAQLSDNYLEAAKIYECSADISLCPERQKYFRQQAAWCRCAAKTLETGSGVTNSDCQRLKPLSNSIPSCPEDAQVKDAAQRLEACRAGRPYNGGNSFNGLGSGSIPYGSGSRSSSSPSTYSSGGGRTLRDDIRDRLTTPEQKAQFDRMKPEEQAILGGAAFLGDAIEAAQQRKEQERAGRQFGTKAEKDVLLAEASQLRYEASGHARGLGLFAGGLSTALGVLLINNPVDKEPTPWAYVITVAGVTITFITILGIVKDISRRSRAKELEWQARNMRVSFTPVIHGVQNGYTYNGLRLSIKF